MGGGQKLSVRHLPAAGGGSMVSIFIVPDGGDKVDSGIGLRPGPPGYIGWQAGTTTLYVGVNYMYIVYLPFRDYEFLALRRVVVKGAFRVLDLPLRQTGLQVLTIEPLREMGG